jgi:hypothetical protein
MISSSQSISKFHPKSKTINDFLLKVLKLCHRGASMKISKTRSLAVKISRFHTVYPATRPQRRDPGLWPSQKCCTDKNRVERAFAHARNTSAAWRPLCLHQMPTSIAYLAFRSHTSHLLFQGLMHQAHSFSTTTNTLLSP